VLKAVLRPLDALGQLVIAALAQIGSVLLLTVDAGRWLGRAVFTRKVRIGRAAMVTQLIRVGVRSVLIISLVSASVGLILSLQMAPPLEQLGQQDKLANIIGVAVLRELGPLISAIVLIGFAGAAITAEIGTMVVGEEIEALEAHALNPVRFLVVPRVIATLLSMTALAVFADIVAIASSIFISVLAVGLTFSQYWDNMLYQVRFVDFYTGVIKAAVFGLLIGAIACANGLTVTGGAAGVGRATTATVVQCVVAVVVADLIFTATFYIFGLV
jgi:phospholipid/cholesterol/gamma-HCH transport system permease protein